MEAVQIAVVHTPQQLPFLEAICWQTNDVTHFTHDEMLNRYERGWVYRGVLADIAADELNFIRTLAKNKGSWLAVDV